MQQQYLGKPQWAVFPLSSMTTLFLVKYCHTSDMHFLLLLSMWQRAITLNNEKRRLVHWEVRRTRKRKGWTGEEEEGFKSSDEARKPPKRPMQMFIYCSVLQFFSLNQSYHFALSRFLFLMPDGPARGTWAGWESGELICSVPWRWHLPKLNGK